MLMFMRMFVVTAMFVFVRMLVVTAMFVFMRMFVVTAMFVFVRMLVVTAVFMFVRLFVAAAVFMFMRMLVAAGDHFNFRFMLVYNMRDRIMQIRMIGVHGMYGQCLRSEIHRSGGDLCELPYLLLDLLRAVRAVQTLERKDQFHSSLRF